jgi:hypothetical protein
MVNAQKVGGARITVGRSTICLQNSHSCRIFAALFLNYQHQMMAILFPASVGNEQKKTLRRIGIQLFVMSVI